MSTQGKYRIRNWKEYNKSLIQRGSITVWLSEDAVEKWFAHRAEGKKGHPCVYSDDAILTSTIYPEFIKKAPKTMKRTYADGAYDTSGCYKANAEHGSIPIICPQRKAVLRREEGPHMDMRNTALLEITGLGGGENGRRLWKKLRRYHRRSGETAMFRFKQLFGNNLRSRSLKGQKAEAYTKSHALNIMTRLGMPRSEWVA